jgi:hypothetical protein
MTLMLELPPDLEARLNSEATRRGLAPADYVLELVRAATPETQTPEQDEVRAETTDPLSESWPEGEPMPTNGAEVVAYWERHGLIGTRPDITDSLAHARVLRREAERREWS